MSFLQRYDSASDADKVKLLFGAIATDPIGLYAELRAQRPILKVPGGPVLLTLFADVEEALTRNTVFTVAPYRPKMDPSVGPFMLAYDDKVYNQRDKGIMRALIQQSDMLGVRVTVGQLAAEAIKTGQSTDGRLELVSQLTRRVPVELTGAYFGFPGPDIATMMRWSYWTQYDMFHNLTDDQTVHENNIKSGQEMRAWLQAWLPGRRQQVAADPKLDDIVARLIRLQTPPAIGFDESRLLTNTMGLLVGGIETTSAATVQAIDQLLDRPDWLARAVAAAKANDTATFDGIFWEALRFNPMNPFVVRLSAAPYTIAAGTPRETEIAPGSLVLVGTASAMHDGTVITDPETFNPDRPAYHYLHLGFGAHRCLGDQVSLQQAPELARQAFVAGFTKRAEGSAGKLDFKGGPFPESFTLVKG